MVRHPLLRSRAAPHMAQKQTRRSPAFLAWGDRRARACMLAAALSVLVMPARAQSNLEAGKSPAQIFADTCNACHRSPREIKRTTAAFLREPYDRHARSRDDGGIPGVCGERSAGGAAAPAAHLGRRSTCNPPSGSGRTRPATAQRSGGAAGIERCGGTYPIRTGRVLAPRPAI